MKKKAKKTINKCQVNNNKSQIILHEKQVDKHLRRLIIASVCAVNIFIIILSRDNKKWQKGNCMWLSEDYFHQHNLFSHSLW